MGKGEQKIGLGQQSVSTTIINNSEPIKCRQVFRETRSLMCCRWECKMVQPLWKTGWQLLNKLNICLLYYPIMVLLGIYPRKNGNLYPYKSQHTVNGKPPKCPSVGECLVEHQRTIPRTPTTGMGLEGIVLSETARLQNSYTVIYITFSKS